MKLLLCSDPHVCISRLHPFIWEYDGYGHTVRWKASSRKGKCYLHVLLPYITGCWSATTVVQSIHLGFTESWVLVSWWIQQQCPMSVHRWHWELQLHTLKLCPTHSSGAQPKSASDPFLINSIVGLELGWMDRAVVVEGLLLPEQKCLPWGGRYDTGPCETHTLLDWQWDTLIYLKWHQTQTTSWIVPSAL